jgi:hypothetical protein
LLQRVRARRRRRGAAMTESAIIAAFMVIQFACIWAAVSYQKAKIGVMDEARVAAWATTIQYCSGGGDVSGDLNQSVGDANAGGVPDISEASNQAGSSFGLANAVFKDSGYPTITKQREAKFPGVIGGSTYTMIGKMHMRCNEPKKNDDGKKYFLIALGAGAIGALLMSLV